MAAGVRQPQAAAMQGAELIVAVAGVGDISQVAASTHPWANFSY